MCKIKSTEQLNAFVRVSYAQYYKFVHAYGYTNDTKLLLRTSLWCLYCFHSTVPYLLAHINLIS